MTFTVASWNINGLRPRLAQVVRYLEERAPDVLCLQEIKVAYGAFPDDRFEALGYRAASFASGHYAGVAILARGRLDRVVCGLDDFEHPRQAGRRVTARIEDPRFGELWVDNVYVPTRMALGKEPFLDALRTDHARRHGDHARVILGGDFNLCFDERDMAAPTMISDASLHPRRPEDLAFRRLLEERALADCFRARCDEPGHYSWFAGALEDNRGMRLDYLFATPPLAEQLVACEHDVMTRTWDSPSDHVPVVARFAL